jgi:hypothetical protein
MQRIKISKSKFIAGVQCLKRMYWQVHQPELAAEPDAAALAIIEQGREVGLLARQLFPGGVEVRSEGGLDQAIRATRELVANREVPAIFEGVFEHDGVLVRVDVLHRRRDGRWRLVEVKSSTSVKEEHLDDVGIQSRVVSRCGVDLASVCLAHINRNYVFDGGSIDVRRLFKVRNLTRRVGRLQPRLTFQLRAAFTVLSMPKAPDIAPGKHCMSPVTCEFFDRCNPPLPDDHIGGLRDPSGRRFYGTIDSALLECREPDGNLPRLVPTPSPNCRASSQGSDVRTMEAHEVPPPPSAKPSQHRGATMQVAALGLAVVSRESGGGAESIWERV